jgi:hypothetical protein
MGKKYTQWIIEIVINIGIFNVKWHIIFNGIKINYKINQ